MLYTDYKFAASKGKVVEYFTDIHHKECCKFDLSGSTSYIRSLRFDCFSFVTECYSTPWTIFTVVQCKNPLCTYQLFIVNILFVIHVISLLLFHRGNIVFHLSLMTKCPVSNLNLICNISAVVQDCCRFVNSVFERLTDFIVVLLLLFTENCRSNIELHWRRAVPTSPPVTGSRLTLYLNSNLQQWTKSLLPVVGGFHCTTGHLRQAF